MRFGSEGRASAAAAAVYCLATLLFLVPAIGDGQRLGPDLGDPLLNLYFLEWGAHQIAIGLPDVWSPPFFFPTPRVLTLSDHLLGPAAAFLGLRSAGLSSAASYNALLLATSVLGGVAAFAVLRRSGISRAGALTGGWVFAFSSFRWSAVGHFQVARMQWIPVVLWAFDRLLERATPRRAVAFLASYGLHVSGGAYLAHLVHIPLAILLVNRWLAGPPPFLTPARLRVWVPAAFGALVVAAFFYFPYLDSGVPLRARHATAELYEHGASLASFATPSALSLEARLLPFLPREQGHGAFFPGFVALALVGTALAAGHTALRGPWPRGLLVSGAVMAGLCFAGPFAAASAVVPGMAAMRVPTRAFAFVAFPLALLVGLGAEVVVARARRSGLWRAAATVAALALVVESAPSLPQWKRLPGRDAFPAYARWIADHPEVGAYLELPLGRDPAGETVPMYLQTLHWRPMANGYSAVLPPSFEELRQLCRPFPDAEGLGRLSALGITHVVVHWRQSDWQPGPAERARVLRFREGFERTLEEAGAPQVFADADTEILAIGAAAPNAVP